MEENLHFLSGIQYNVQTFKRYPGHMAIVSQFSGRNRDVRCSECSTGLSDQRQQGFSNYHYILLLQRLARLVRDKKHCEEMYGYKKSFISSRERSQDYFYRQKFLKLCKLYGGEKNLENKICLAVSTDA